MGGGVNVTPAGDVAVRGSKATEPVQPFVTDVDVACAAVHHGRVVDVAMRGAEWRAEREGPARVLHLRGQRFELAATVPRQLLVRARRLDRRRPLIPPRRFSRLSRRLYEDLLAAALGNGLDAALQVSAYRDGFDLRPVTEAIAALYDDEALV